MIDFDKILDYLNKLNGLPGGALVAILCIVTCYAARFAPWIPNRFIPTICFLCGAVLWPILAPMCPAGTPVVQWRVRNVVIGLIVGMLAWIFHKAVLNRFEDKWPWLKNMLDSGDQKVAEPVNPPVVPPIEPPKP